MLNDALVDTRCVSQPAGDGARPYPFSVSSIRRALKITGDDAEQVNVLVVDNSFYGYRPNRSGDGPPRLSSRNYPKNFFFNVSTIQGDFAPWIKPGDVSEVPPPGDEKRHGTHVAGIVLGGMYEGDVAPNENSNLREPSARSLLLFNNADKPWLRLSFLNVEYGSENEIDDPVVRLSTLSPPQMSEFEIVNMSLAKELTGREPPEQLPGRALLPALIVTAAGNGEDQLSKDSTGLRTIPAIFDDERMLIVASHDADENLSPFSNYGGQANIAAPGCQIKSWTDGDKDAVALSGTSMATAVVTFAAALVRSRWQPPGGGTAIRNRMLASARYNKALDECTPTSPAIPRGIVSPDTNSYCVKDGAMLDIETALLINRDYIEYDDCGPSGDQPCTAKVALGEATSVPEAITSCIGQIAEDVRHHGMSLNGAIKRTGQGSFLVAYEPGLAVGAKPLQTEPCDLRPDQLSQQLEFDISGPQLSGPDVTPLRTEPISLGKLKRLVTRATN